MVVRYPPSRGWWDRGVIWPCGDRMAQCQREIGVLQKWLWVILRRETGVRITLPVREENGKVCSLCSTVLCDGCVMCCEQG